MANLLDDLDENDTEDSFIEQAEYIDPEKFLALSAEHPKEEFIVQKLTHGGAKLLVGPRGCGKTTLMLKAFHSALNDEQSTSFPIYVNFKLSLKLEPLYQTSSNASFWFQKWIILRIYEGIFETFAKLPDAEIPENFPDRAGIMEAIADIEAGIAVGKIDEADYSFSQLSEDISDIVEERGAVRAILLLDDAAHAFSPKQQEDFFEFFRKIKAKHIAPKAAIYPGITTISPNFQIGHDAEKIDVWIRPDSPSYLEFMRSLGEKRISKTLFNSILREPDALDFLAYTSFGIPRSFLNMVRQLEGQVKEEKNGIDRRKLLDAAKGSRDAAHAVFDSLEFKLPAYKVFIETGDISFNTILEIMRNFNKNKDLKAQGFEFAVKRPVSTELSRLFSFFQYAGLIMPTGENSRGDKGTFDIYLAHFADLVSQNIVVGRRAKSLTDFVNVFKTKAHQAWPRINPDNIANADRNPEIFRLTLPHCSVCGAERTSEQAKFCHNCGSQLKNTSLYESLISQKIRQLPISVKIAKRIESESNIKRVKDILMDSTKEQLRGVSYIGPIRAERIFRYAEEFVA